MGNKLVTWVAFLFLTLTAAACAPATASTVETTYFKINEGYVNAAAVQGMTEKAVKIAGSAEESRADASAKLAAEWAEAKYTTSVTKEDGYQSAERLVIADRKLGQWRVGNTYLYLPPGTHQNIPAGDSEIVEIDALCLDAGQIAFKNNFEGILEIKQARATCYDIPLSGWTVDAILTVDNEQVAYQRLSNGDYQFMGPGNYPQQINSKWIKEPAVVVSAGTFAIYVDPVTGNIRSLASGVHTDVVPSFVRYYRSSTLHYTSRSEYADCEKLAQNAGAPYCMTSIDNVTISGTTRQAIFDVDSDFMFLEPTGEVLSQYKTLPDINSVVRDIFEMKMRAYYRSLCADLTQDILATEGGKAECSRRVQDRINTEFLGKVPLKVLSMEIRAIDFQDGAFRTQQAAIQDRITLAKQEQLAAAEELKSLADRKALNEQRAQNISDVINIQDGISCTELLVLEGLGLIETIEWTKMPTGMCTAGGINTNVTVTP